MPQPYVYQEYPRTLHRPDGRTCSVRSDEEKVAALAEGWALVPVVDLTGNRFDGAAVAEVVEVPAVDVDVPEVVEDAPPPVKRKKGRA